MEIHAQPSQTKLIDYTGDWGVQKCLAKLR